MAQMKILNAQEEEAFESPSVFNNVERNKYFDFPSSLAELTKNLRTSTNKVYFLVMLGYFRATNKFFKRAFLPKDINFVARKLEISLAEIKASSYDKQTYLHHKQMILEYCGFKEFGEEVQEIIAQEITSIAYTQSRPKLILLEILDVMNRKRIEIPGYRMLATLIVEKVNHPISPGRVFPGFSKPLLRIPCITSSSSPYTSWASVSQSSSRSRSKMWIPLQCASG